MEPGISQLWQDCVCLCNFLVFILALLWSQWRSLGVQLGHHGGANKNSSSIFPVCGLFRVMEQLLAIGYSQKNIHLCVTQDEGGVNITLVILVHLRSIFVF